jgi:hypothetical protein
MSPFTGDDEAMQRAGWIASRSWIATLGDFVVGRSVASARSSRALMLARRCLQEFQSLPAAERARCELIASAAAVAGHVVLAALLPASARPMISVTAVALLAVGLTVSMSAK